MEMEAKMGLYSMVQVQVQVDQSSMTEVDRRPVGKAMRRVKEKQLRSTLRQLLRILLLVQGGICEWFEFGWFTVEFGPKWEKF